MLEPHGPRLKPGVRHQPEPVPARERALDVPIPFHAHRSVRVAQQVRIVDSMRAVGRIRSGKQRRDGSAVSIPNLTCFSYPLTATTSPLFNTSHSWIFGTL